MQWNKRPRPLRKTNPPRWNPEAVIADHQSAAKRVGRQERGRIGKAHLPYDVPVGAARRERQRAAREEAEEPPFGVEQVEKGSQVALVRAASVQEDEGAGRS